MSFARLALVWALLVTAPVLVACSHPAQGASACGPVVREALDPNVGHVLPGAAEPAYRTDPPTSGPHTPTAIPAGVLDHPLTRPVQVGALEGGTVLVQYRDAADLDALRPLAAGHVVVAPNPSLKDAVVLTAWLFKQTCSRVDAASISAFAAAHGGHGPGSD